MNEEKTRQLWKVIFFNTIALGDFLIHSKVLHDLKRKTNCRIVAVCSPYNSRIISNENYIDEIIIYNKKWNFFHKLQILKKIFKYKYKISIVFDAQPFSYFANFLLKSKYKRGIVTRKIKKIFYIKFTFYKPLKILSKLLFDKYEVQTRPKYLEKKEFLPKKYINLLKDFNLPTNVNNVYSFNSKEIDEIKKNNLLKKINFKKYLCIHLDEKWQDIKDIEHKLNQNLDKLQKKTKLKILIFVYKNKCSYYKKLEKNINIINSKNLKINRRSKNKKIYILKDSSIFLEERTISSSLWNISCHAGILVHSAVANKRKIIDIIPYSEILKLSCWVPKKFYFAITKEKSGKKINIDKIFDIVVKKINKII